MTDVLCNITMILIIISFILFVIFNILEIIHSCKFWKRMEEDRKRELELKYLDRNEDKN